MCRWLKSLFRRVTGFDGGTSVNEEAVPSVQDDEILLAELHIVQSMDADGDLHIYDLSQGSDGGELDPAKQLELLEWGRAAVLAPMVWGLMQAYMEDECDECEGE